MRGDHHRPINNGVCATACPVTIDRKIAFTDAILSGRSAFTDIVVVFSFRKNLYQVPCSFAVSSVSTAQKIGHEDSSQKQFAPTELGNVLCGTNTYVYALLACSALDLLRGSSFERAPLDFERALIDSETPQNERDFQHHVVPAEPSRSRLLDCLGMERRPTPQK
jgi:hypothetical protein